MTTGLFRVCLLAAASLGAAGFACNPQPDAPELRIALRSGVPAATGIDVLAGDTVGVVRLSPAPTTIVSTPAGHLLAPFRAAVAGTDRPATSPAVTLRVPEPSPGELAGMPFDIVFFTDVNGDGAWQGGEPFATAWSGGSGSYRLIAEGPSREGRPRWRLLEGGEPPTVREPTSDVVVYIDPVRPAVER